MENKFETFFDIESEMLDNGTISISDRETFELLERISLESHMVNIECDMDLSEDLTESDIDFTSQFYSMEGLGEQLKNKAKRAGSNITILMKKAINFIFGFVINLFKGTINTKSVLKKQFEILKKYQKALQDLRTKNISEEFEMESKDYSARGIASLEILMLTQALMTHTITGANSSTNTNTLTKAAGLCSLFAGNFKLANDTLANGDKSEPINISKINDLFKNAKGKVDDIVMIQKVNEQSKSFFTKVIDTVFFGFKIIGGKDKQKQKDKNNNSGIDFELNTELPNIIKTQGNRFKTICSGLENDPPSKTVKGIQLISYYAVQVEALMSLITNNKWDFEKQVSSLVKLRDRTLKEISKISTDGLNENDKSTVETTMQSLTGMGTALSDITDVVRTSLKNIKSDIDNLITEITKVGAKASKVTS